MKWAGFAEAAPELARLAKERFDGAGIVLVGTVRRDGSPRISPVEFLIWDGELFLGMMWQSRKALDLLRDPRCVVHSVVVNKDGKEGEVKLRCPAVDVRDPDHMERYCQALYEQTAWRPEGPFHLFTLDIGSAVFIKYLENGDQLVKEWRLGRPERERVRRWTGSGVVDDDA